MAAPTTESLYSKHNIRDALTTITDNIVRMQTHPKKGKFTFLIKQIVNDYNNSFEPVEGSNYSDLSNSVKQQFVVAEIIYEVPKKEIIPMWNEHKGSFFFFGSPPTQKQIWNMFKMYRYVADILRDIKGFDFKYWRNHQEGIIKHIKKELKEVPNLVDSVLGTT